MFVWKCDSSVHLSQYATAFLRNCRKCRPENSKRFTCAHLDLEQFWTEDVIRDTKEQTNRLHQVQQHIQEMFRWSTDDIATLSACQSNYETCLNFELLCLISNNRTSVFCVLRCSLLRCSPSEGRGREPGRQHWGGKTSKRQIIDNVNAPLSGW